MHMTEEGLALIRRFEGYRGKAYRCPAGIWTIGYGHTSQAGPPVVSEGLEIDRATAAGILARDVDVFAGEVRRLLSVELSPQQFSALVSFSYNVGVGNLRKSPVLRAVNAGDFAAVPRRLQLWNKAGGRVLPGLVKRRAAEAALFLGGAPEGSPPLPGPVSVSEGKPLRRSTTVLAALISVLTGSGSVLFSGLAGVINWLVVAVLLIGLAFTGFWIIHERRRKAAEEGV